MDTTTSAPTATTTGSNKLRILLIPIFATSHIQPFTELAICLARANDAVEATVAVTPSNISIVQSLLDRGHNVAAVKTATYPFPMVDGLPKGMENFGNATTPDDSSRMMVASISEALTRPAQEKLIREQSPDAIITDITFFWNSAIADDLGVPCVAFSVIGAFSMLAIRLIVDNMGNDDEDDGIVVVPRLHVPPIQIPRKELPGSLRRNDCSFRNKFVSLQADCFGYAMNTSSELEKQYCEMYKREGYVKRAYFLGPLALLSPSPTTTGTESEGDIMDWLDSKPNCSVVYLSFGSMAHIKDSQLDELALGLEISGTSFLWVLRGMKEWSPPKGWEERVGDRGFIIRTWAPQTAILRHHAVGAFVTQCGWNSILETVAAGVPVLTWPYSYEQFITERLVTEVLGIGERVWPDGAGLRSGSYDEHDLIPHQDVAHALTGFLCSGGPGDTCRIKVTELAKKVEDAVAQGGSSHRDLHRLVDDLLMAAAKRTT